MDKRTLIGSLLAAVALSFGSHARAEVDEVKLASQYGIGYLPLTVMQVDKLVEKHLAKANMGTTKVSWMRLAAGAAANDALLSGGLHFASGGTGPAIILWDKTRTSLDVGGVAALSSMPNLLVTRNPAIKTVRDFTVPVLLYGAAVRDLCIRILRRRRRLQSKPQDHVPGGTPGATGAPQMLAVQTGEFLRSAEDVASLVVGVNNGRPVYLNEVADVRVTCVGSAVAG